MLKDSVKKTLKRVGSYFIRRVTIKHDGFSLTGRLTDYGFLRALARSEREPYMYELFKSQVHADTVAVDLGAHLGHYTLAAARAVGPRGKVFAFEADPETLSYLRNNLEKNQLASLVECTQAAVTDKIGSVTFQIDTLQPDFSSTQAKRTGASIKSITVPSLTLDAFFADKERKPDLIKMDIEGAESLALLGAKGLLTGTKKPLLFVESNPQALQAFHLQPAQLVEQIKALGYDVKLIDENKKALRVITPEDLQECCNLFCK
jgi:FkbM family methyltransferase